MVDRSVYLLASSTSSCGVVVAVVLRSTVIVYAEY